MIPSAVRTSQDAADHSARRQSSQTPLAAGAPCPCCGQAMPKSKRSVSLNVDRGQVRRGDVSVRLSPDAFAVFEAIFESYPRRAETTFIHQWAYDTRPRDRQPHQNSVKVHVCKLRRELAPLGLAIITEYRRGYRLEIGG